MDAVGAAAAVFVVVVVVVTVDNPALKSCLVSLQ